MVNIVYTKHYLYRSRDPHQLPQVFHLARSLNLIKMYTNKCVIQVIAKYIDSDNIKTI